MGYKDVLVYLDDGASNEERINTAFLIAKEQGARLTGVTLAAVKPAYSIVSDAQALASICKQEAEQRTADFMAQSEQQGISAESRIIYGDEEESPRKLAQFCRNFDLVILRQANPKNRNYAMIKEVSQQVILISGRPVFFMPYIGAHKIPCQLAMIAWDGSPAATRAVHDALPLLKTIDSVDIVIVQQGKQKTARGELLADDLASHLQRHGVNARVKRLNAGTYDVPTVILNEIAEQGVDLLVMGGYGTPKLKQKIFGGVTRSLLSSMLIPVLMSH